jgi:hypothetical protein
MDAKSIDSHIERRCEYESLVRLRNLDEEIFNGTNKEFNEFLA